MREEVKRKVAELKEEMKDKAVIRFKEYMDFLDWKQELGLISEMEVVDFYDTIPAIQYNKVYFEGQYNKVVALIEIELPF